MSNLPIKEKPILFSGAMVRAILDGRKTQTRRIVKPHGWTVEQMSKYEFVDVLSSSESSILTCNATTAYAGFKLSPDASCPAYFKFPLGDVGDQLWVRETFGKEVRNYGGGSGEFTVYKASKPNAVYCTTAEGKSLPVKWRPSIHMPRQLSRIQLEITGLRVERLQDISEEDAVAEGIELGIHGWKSTKYKNTSYTQPAMAFQDLWESTGGDWEANPWVWVINFKRVKP